MIFPLRAGSFAAGREIFGLYYSTNKQVQCKIHHESNKFSAEITINENTVVKELINVNKDCVTQDWWT